MQDEKDNTVYTPAEQERIARARRRKPRKEIVEDGFYPRRRGGARLPVNRTAFDREAKAFVQNRLDTFLPDMSRTAKDNLNRALRKSFDEVADLGLTGKKAEDYIRRNISNVIGKKNLGRAMGIARTEGSALSNFAMSQSATQTGLILTKEWLTVRDGNVRDSHIIADGTEINQEEQFIIGGSRMDYPSDSKYGALPKEVINCRCTLIYHERRI